jgi:peptidoglycan/xylan/chitin deacetylase (PgdA/CDA1 family)
VAVTTEAVPARHWRKGEWEETFGVPQPTKLRQNWPAGRRIAITFTFDTQSDVDAAVPGSTGRWKTGHVNYADLTQRQYDTTVAVGRVLELLGEYDVKATFPVCGVTAEWYPETVQAIKAAGHEVAVHGHWHTLLHTLSPQEERAEIESATRAVTEVLGERPKGWVSPVFSITPRTLPIIEELGYLWDSDFHNADMPYILRHGDKQIVELPVGLNDWDLYLMQDALGARMGGVPYASPSHVTDVLCSQFNQLYKESAREPRVFHYCMHPKITGRPYRAWGLSQFIEYAKNHDGVWFTTCSELAQLCV